MDNPAQDIDTIAEEKVADFLERRGRRAPVAAQGRRRAGRDD